MNNMIKGLGVDATSVQRCLNKEEHFVKKFFHSDEYEHWKELQSSAPAIRAQFLASRFAVKEAYAKARGTGFCADVIPCEINTVKDKSGKPEVRLYGRTLASHPQGCAVHVSITHEDALAIAVVIIEKES